MIIFIFVVLAFVFMEFMAWFTHKFIMHGFLWNLHEDHHQPRGKFFQKNDLFFLIFAIPSWLNIMFGFIYQNDIMIGIGFGIAVYGLAYFLVHDILIHRRKKWLDKTDNRYFRAVRKAHKVHHKNQYKEKGACFGMLLFPFKYY
ncbi:MAG: carotene hydroxylase [Crocinitomix sp.]|nr:carotene hydroxylase [Crocinitomix sp.]